jgi:hypothetical protein
VRACAVRCAPHICAARRQALAPGPCSDWRRLAYQPQGSSTFLSEQISHQQPVSSNSLSEQISHQQPVSSNSLSEQISHQPNQQAAGTVHEQGGRGHCACTRVRAATRYASTDCTRHGIGSPVGPHLSSTQQPRANAKPYVALVLIVTRAGQRLARLQLNYY